MPHQPSAEILETFGVCVVAPLGGRQNQHWLVEGRGERLVLRRWNEPADSVAYELNLLAKIAALGWPVAQGIGSPIARDGHLWSFFQFLPGEPPATENPGAEQRARGRLLAQFHAELARLTEIGQRREWRRCEEILGDTTLDHTLTENERYQPDEVHILRWHLARARRRIAGLPLRERPGQIIHGDFTPWNLRFRDGRLSGILDFELSRWDHRIGDFALSWRGKYDEVIHGYAEVSPLEPEEWDMLTPLWWAELIELACRCLRDGTWDDGWIIKKLLQRSPLMGPDAAEFR